MIQILILDRDNTLIAEASHPETAMVCADREWQEGDHMENTGWHMHQRPLKAGGTSSLPGR